MKKSRLFVISIREIIYTLIFLILGILLIILLFYMFLPNDNNVEQTSSSTYIPGMYTSCMTLEDSSFTLQLTVDKDSINSIDLINSSESVATVYPLIPECLESIETQLINNTPIDELSVNEDSKYTQILLTNAIKDLLNKAAA